MAITFPEGTSVGQTYTDGTSTWVYNGTAWEYLSPSKSYFQADPPVAGVQGQNWTNTNTGRLYTYLDGQWINEGSTFTSKSAEIDKVRSETTAGSVNPIGYPMTWREAKLAPLKHSIENPTAYDTQEGDWFGFDVDITDSYFIVGAPYEDDAGGTTAGKAYVYSTTSGALLHTIDNPSTIRGSTSTVTRSDAFGRAVAICESYFIVGAQQDDQQDSFPTGSNSGRAYIFNASTGALLHTLDNPNPETHANFGCSVAITESYTIVGAYGADIPGSGYSNAGRAYIFNTSTGSLLHTLDNPNPEGSIAGNIAQDKFGFDVDITESYAIVGTVGEDESDGSGGTFNDSGKAYIFSTSTGALLHTLVNPNAYDTPANDTFGKAVSICESYAIAGAEYEDDLSGGGSGKAYIFNASTGALLHTLDNPNPSGSGSNDNFGCSVAITESYAIVGAEGESTYAGKVYIYNTSTGALLHTLDNPNMYGAASYDRYGDSVAICESYAIGGAGFKEARDDSSNTGFISDNSGATYVYGLETKAGIDAFYSANSPDNRSNLIAGSTTEETMPFIGYSIGSDANKTTVARLMQIKLNQLGPVMIGAAQSIPLTMTTSWDSDTNQFVNENGSFTTPNLRAGLTYYGISMFVKYYSSSSLYPVWAIMGMNPDTNEVQLPGPQASYGNFRSIVPANGRLFFIGVADDEEHISLLSNPDTMIQPTHIGTNPAGYTAEWEGSNSSSLLPPVEAMAKPWA